MPGPTRFRALLAHTACLTLLAAVALVIEGAIAPVPAEARAGGSYGSPSSANGATNYRRPNDRRNRSETTEGDRRFLMVMGVIVVIYGATLLRKRMKGEAPTSAGSQPARRRLDELIAQAAARDGIWREEVFLEQAREAFYAVQRAWVARNQDIAKDVMTPALYARHKVLTDKMTAMGETNHLKDLKILSAKLVHMADHLDDRQDELWIRFTASAYDALVDERTGAVKRGSVEHLSVFKEIWKFKRDGRHWQVDAIDPNVTQALPQSQVETAA